MGQMMHYGWSCGPFAMIGAPWGSVLNLLFWALLIAGAIWLGRRLVGRNPTATSRETPLETLKRRYAAGEIGRDDFERMKREVGA